MVILNIQNVTIKPRIFFYKKTWKFKMYKLENNGVKNEKVRNVQVRNDSKPFSI